jgi:hypothetical protein
MMAWHESSSLFRWTILQTVLQAVRPLSCASTCGFRCSEFVVDSDVEQAMTMLHYISVIRRGEGAKQPMLGWLRLAVD